MILMQNKWATGKMQWVLKLSILTGIPEYIILKKDLML